VLLRRRACARSRAPVWASATTRVRANTVYDSDLDLDREIEYAFDTEEPMLGRPAAGDVE
jgi:hypothetical protein